MSCFHTHGMDEGTTAVANNTPTPQLAYGPPGMMQVAEGKPGENSASTPDMVTLARGNAGIGETEGNPVPTDMADGEMYQRVVNNMSWVSTIGAAITATSAVGSAGAQGLFGKTDDEAMKKVEDITVLLTWASAFFLSSTAITAAVAMQYAGRGFPTMMLNRKNFNLNKRHKYNPDRPFDVIAAEIAVAMIWCAIIFQTTGLLALVEALGVYSRAPAIFVEGVVGVTVLVVMISWATTEATTREDVKRRWMKLVCLA